jgi:peptidoglycan/LPS O-acetylase OafA/YrhL
VVISPNLIRSTTISFEKILKSFLFIPYEDSLKENLPILGQGWTLRFEMLFYVVMSLCILFVKNKKHLPAVCALVLMALAVFLNIFAGSSNDIFILRYYAQGGLLVEFLYGIALYISYDFFKNIFHNKNLNIATGISIIIPSIAAIISFLFLILKDAFHLSLSAIRCIDNGIPSLILVMSFLLLEKYIRRDNKVIKFCILLGDASYAMYLFHYHIFAVLSRIIYPRIPILDSFTWELVKLFISMFAIIFGSLAIYLFMDKPVQRFFKKTH